MEEREELASVATQGYCQALRSALTDDDRAPLDAAGLRLREQLIQISCSRLLVETERSYANRRGGFP